MILKYNLDNTKTKWILDSLNIPKSLLPKLQQSSKIYGKNNYSIRRTEIIISETSGKQIQWLRDNLELLKIHSNIKTIATFVNDNEDTHIVPILIRFGIHHWNPYSTKQLLNLNIWQDLP
ncbi:hypothetical protein [Borrelia persica]|uniref:hypothetical protein n=1 Tax=Borrelia persica TaxID=44448 RepID=UPI000466E48A|nr:hypothetical protein [Borrelia persica]